MPMPMFFGFQSGISVILMLVAVVISGFAQARISSTFGKYNKVRSRRNKSAYDTARYILDYNGLKNVRIEKVAGNLTDHYDPRNKVLRLSDTTYNSTSVAALGVAAHEAGHAIQDQVGYVPLRIRGALVPVASFGSSFSFILIFAGLMMEAFNLIDIGIILFSAAVLFQIVTLPVEFNASSRALAALEGSGILEADEIPPTKKVLDAAALTYVAAALVSILQLVRLILIRNSRR